MGYTIEQFGADCHASLKKGSDPGGLEEVRQNLERALKDEAFVAKHLGTDNDSPRKIIYEDPELEFCILAHVFVGAKDSPPHDHGPAWAVYGQATGVTVMTDWKCVKKPADGNPGEVEKVTSYELKPGMARAYATGDLHSPSRADETRLIRIEGKNMEKVKRDSYRIAVPA